MKVTWCNGTIEYYQNNLLHRTDGPAVVWEDGSKYWYIEGEHLTEEEFNERTKPTGCSGKTVTIKGVKYKLVRM